jgi:protein-S-isoprenylcysteine O-methyltransferase Ste14
MRLATVSVYVLIACYFVVERSLRKGQPALDLKPGEFDVGSSKVLLLSGTICLSMVVAAPLLNTHSIGYWGDLNINWLGLVAMVAGLGLRFWSAKTLGEFYTRTLRMVENQTIVRQPPYNVIRHPGYLGTLLMEIGAGLALANWIILLTAIVIGIPSRVYRICVEERMLETSFGQEYQTHSNSTWKLVPFVY